MPIIIRVGWIVDEYNEHIYHKYPWMKKTNLKYLIVFHFSFDVNKTDIVHYGVISHWKNVYLNLIRQIQYHCYIIRITHGGPK